MPVLVDTCILIDCLRRNRNALEFLVRLPDKPLLSVVSVTEIYAGFRVGEELLIAELLNSFAILTVEIEIGELAGRYLHRYRPSHGIDVPDALIAATAREHGLTLAPLNTKHFPMLRDVHRPY